jgi:hypothetical protein
VVVVAGRLTRREEQEEPVAVVQAEVRTKQPVALTAQLMMLPLEPVLPELQTLVVAVVEVVTRITALQQVQAGQEL